MNRDASTDSFTLLFCVCLMPIAPSFLAESLCFGKRCVLEQNRNRTELRQDDCGVSYRKGR